MKIASSLTVAAAVITAAVCLAPASADASSPRCHSGSGLSGYWSGYNLQSRLLEQIWRYNYEQDCSNLESFVSAIDVPFNPSATSPSLACRNEGISEATQDIIWEKTESCAEECAESGADIGALEGRIFCNVSSITIQRAMKLCSLVAQQSCRASLDSYVRNNCNWAREADLSRYGSFLSSACAL